jgi:flavin-dependent dehydrogenase
MTLLIGLRFQRFNGKSGMREDYDVVVVGAGPAGGTAAAVTAMGGLGTLLIERESVPRFHVGESLMPEAYWPLERIGLNARVRDAGWQIKKSVQFVTGNGKESTPFFFRDHDDRDCADTWQVERSEFDKMLFDRAAECGADCYDQVRLMDVEFDDSMAARAIRVKDADGNERRITCRVVMDATGQHSFIANKLGLKELNPDLRKAAIWGYWRDAARDEGDNGGATIILQTEDKNAWFWFIPQSRGITSIGCVGDFDYLLKGRGKPEEVYAKELSKCPGLRGRLENARLVGDLSVKKEFSYWTRQHSGQGWVLIGDAFGFIDPIYSSGVYFALEMGVRAADAVIEGFQKDDLSADQLGQWAESFKQGSNWVRKLVHAFYEKNFSMGGFLKQHPQYAGHLTNVLIGRVFDSGVAEMFDAMDREIEKSRMMSMSA